MITVTNIACALGFASCYICLSTLISSCIFHTNWKQCFTYVICSKLSSDHKDNTIDISVYMHQIQVVKLHFLIVLKCVVM